MRKILLAAALAVAGCAHSASGDLEARVAKIEQTLVKYNESLEFLNKVYAEQKAQADAREREEPDPDAIFAVDVAQDVREGAVDGPPTAVVTIIKCFDFACPHCARMAPALDEVVKQYAGKVRVVYKHMVVHPEVAMPAHLASCAAAKQGKYIAFKTAWWDQGWGPYAASQGSDKSSMSEDNILKIAASVGLDVGKLKTDMASVACKQSITADMTELAKFHVNGTPTLFINGSEIPGAIDKSELTSIVDAKIKEAEKSGVPGRDYYDKVVMAKGEKQFKSKKK
jgi:protein-disulfide isomerase